MLLPVRRLAGLGDVPRQCTTNDVESENMNIKREMNWHKKTWDDAVNHLEARVLGHYEELSRAVYKEGRYRLTEHFRHLEKEPYDWSAMDVNERRSHLQKANLRSLPREGGLSIQHEECGIQGFSVTDLRSLWDTGDILSCADTIVSHRSNATKTVVFEGNDVYAVSKDGHQFRCDSRCDRYKYFDNLLCHHTLAAAEKNDTLVTYLEWINTTIAAKSAAMFNAAINDSCCGAGEKKSKRKGKNNCLAKDIDVMESRFTHPKSKTSVPQFCAVLPTGAGAACAADRVDLPPLTDLQISVQQRQPFSVTFRHGLIRRCRGCGKEFSPKTKEPPNDLILKKQDFKEYPKDGLWYRSKDLANTYYHFNMECVRKNFPHTEARDFILYEDVKDSLSSEHVAKLHKIGFHGACCHPA